MKASIVPPAPCQVPGMSPHDGQAHTHTLTHLRACLLPIFQAADLIIPLRVSVEDELLGLDKSMHGEKATDEDLMEEGGKDGPHFGKSMSVSG